MAIEARGSNGFLYFAVGALAIAVVVLGVTAYNNGGFGQSQSERAIESTANAISGAAEAVEDRVRE